MRRRLADQAETPDSMDVEDSSSEDEGDRISDVEIEDFDFVRVYAQPIVAMEAIQFAQQHDFVAFT